MLTAIVASLVAVAGVIVPTAPASAVAAASRSNLKALAIYYQRTGNVAQREIVVGSMATSSTRESRLWGDFMDSWSTINAQLDMNYTVPKGLPSKGHVFVVLGSALSKSGKITTKLSRRLTVAVSALKKYPHSRVLVSGGAARNGHTEAGVMRSWLRSHGIADSRIIVEKKSASTIGNADYSMAILAASSKYTSYSLISDSSHLRRASILFLAATVRIQEKSGRDWSIRQLANVAYKDMASAGKGPLSASSIAYTASNVASVFDLSGTYRDVVADPPAKAVLTSVNVTAPTKLTYAVGDAFAAKGLVVRAVYNKGVYSRPVTGDADVQGFDSSSVGGATATATFTEGDVTKASSFAYTVVKADSSLKLSFSTKTVRASKTRVVVTAKLAAPNKLSPTGRVRFYLDGKRLKTFVIDADDTGTYTLTYPKIATTGGHAFVVKYSGDDQLEAARTAATLTVSK
ncbi:MAG: YdcF family protein [Actinobacteria bacterium]|nr:YdcF family protein [Actinomycetota bacterium]